MSGATPVPLHGISHFVYGAFTLFGCNCPVTIRLCSLLALLWSSTPCRSMVWAFSFSLAATWEIDFSFSSSGYLDVSVHRVSSSETILFIPGYMSITPCGFPHSDICGSSAVCAFPQLIAACHVLLRLLLPRHPPYALFRLIF